MSTKPVQILVYMTETGAKPYEKWFLGLKDKNLIATIAARLHMVQGSYLGDSRNLGNGVLELRIHLGPGYRIYLGFDGATIVILLCGGDKSTQDKDISKAKKYWKDYKRRTK